MAEYDIYDLANGGRSFTDAEQDLVDNGLMPLSERIKILNEPNDAKREFDSKDSSSGYSVNVFNPLSVPVPPTAPPAPPVSSSTSPRVSSPPVSSSTFTPLKGILRSSTAPKKVRFELPTDTTDYANEYKALSDKVREMNAEIQNERLQNERLRNERLQNERLQNERLRNEHIQAERLMRQTREYDNALYNRLYNWGISLVPDYYTYLQKRQLENSLRNLIKSELLLNTPNHALENLIRKVVSEGDTMQLVNKTSPAEENPAAAPPKRKTARRKSKSPAKKKSSAKKPTRKASKRQSQRRSKKRSKK